VAASDTIRPCFKLINGTCAQGRDEHEIEETLLNIMIVFKYIEDKDVFQKFYSKNLARRLVNEQSSSDQMEAEMISQLKTACGTEYTNKLQRMITVSKLSSTPASERASEPGAGQSSMRVRACVRATASVWQRCSGNALGVFGSRRVVLASVVGNAAAASHHNAQQPLRLPCFFE
jgi:hypothetical protein